mmetsp:Transcript_6654/g.18517  ORF Transcript_6654/g.18517 Transcript_6654/m.18517 type:complete len:571 (+) Transcript_6654:781-2493(+)
MSTSSSCNNGNNASACAAPASPQRPNVSHALLRALNSSLGALLMVATACASASRLCGEPEGELDLGCGSKVTTWTVFPEPLLSDGECITPFLPAATCCTDALTSAVPVFLALLGAGPALMPFVAVSTAFFVDATSIVFIFLKVGDALPASGCTSSPGTRGEVGAGVGTAADICAAPPTAVLRTRVGGRAATAAAAASAVRVLSPCGGFAVSSRTASSRSAAARCAQTVGRGALAGEAPASRILIRNWPAGFPSKSKVKSPLNSMGSAVTCTVALPNKSSLFRKSESLMMNSMVSPTTQFNSLPWWFHTGSRVFCSVHVLNFDFGWPTNWHTQYGSETPSKGLRSALRKPRAASTVTRSSLPASSVSGAPFPDITAAVLLFVPLGDWWPSLALAPVGDPPVRIVLAELWNMLVPLLPLAFNIACETGGVGTSCRWLLPVKASSVCPASRKELAAAGPRETRPAPVGMDLERPATGPSCTSFAFGGFCNGSKVRLAATTTARSSSRKSSETTSQCAAATWPRAPSASSAAARIANREPSALTASSMSPRSLANEELKSATTSEATSASRAKA